MVFLKTNIKVYHFVEYHFPTAQFTSLNH